MISLCLLGSGFILHDSPVRMLVGPYRPMMIALVKAIALQMQPVVRMSRSTVVLIND
jgi:hypothetical protein